MIFVAGFHANSVGDSVALSVDVCKGMMHLVSIHIPYVKEASIPKQHKCFVLSPKAKLPRAFTICKQSNLLRHLYHANDFAKSSTTAFSFLAVASSRSLLVRTSSRMSVFLVRTRLSNPSSKARTRFTGIASR